MIKKVTAAPSGARKGFNSTLKKLINV